MRVWWFSNQPFYSQVGWKVGKGLWLEVLRLTCSPPPLQPRSQPHPLCGLDSAEHCLSNVCVARKAYAEWAIWKADICKPGTSCVLIQTDPMRVLKLCVRSLEWRWGCRWGLWGLAQAHFGLLCRGIHHQTVWIKLCPCQGWCCKCELWLLEFIDVITLHFSSACIYMNTWILFTLGV